MKVKQSLKVSVQTTDTFLTSYMVMPINILFYPAPEGMPE
ncbi:hypothetical protein H171_2667 [[Clostridium] celerecrescens 18A]|uniref:Uncharacterized protein n=1 Tax=[Clostridium] celerecrescens 18A TaxID=1286362 RepID=A0A2M8Z6Q9_9FIRM|nr:hypothetical protein H171_2667 [[Clostridium] celerecrescens 18A]